VTGPAAGTEVWTVAVDVGGTFTDAVAIGSRGGRRLAKVPSTPADPSRGFGCALDELAAQGVIPTAVQLVAHGTTVATNALLTGQLARVVLVATLGFRDILGFRSGSRPDLYSLTPSPPLELVARCDRIEVAERLDHRGRAVVALTDEEVERVVEEVARRQPEAVAIALLFSYRDDQHEQRLAEAIQRRLPRVPISRSARCAREFREYPRTATCALNAALRPLVGRYLVAVDLGLRAAAVPGRLVVMQSSGGVVAARRADQEAHRLAVSGPAGGVTGAAALGRRLRLDPIISMDMGGTSLDACFISGGVPPVRAQQWLGGHPVLSAAVDVEAVGAGGGSLVRVDRAGRLRVGPQSAGSDPGPAAYGRGGTEATVTDAHVVVGSLGPATRLAGRLALDRGAARAAVERVGRQVGLDADTAAAGIVAVTLAQIAGALRRVSVERGHDPRTATLVAFGGAGPLHAGFLLRDLGLRRAVIPINPGLFAAAGLVAAELRLDEARTVLGRVAPPLLGESARWLRATGARLARELVADGVRPEAVRLWARADCRYEGQGYELAVPLAGTTVAELRGLRSAFDRAHAVAYGHASPAQPVELVTLRIAALGAAVADSAPPRRTVSAAPPAPVDHRRVRHPHRRTRERVAIYRREHIAPGCQLEGPLLVEQMDATTWVLEAQTVRADLEGNLVIQHRSP